LTDYAYWIGGCALVSCGPMTSLAVAPRACWGSTASVVAIRRVYGITSADIVRLRSANHNHYTHLCLLTLGLKLFLFIHVVDNRVVITMVKSQYTHFLGNPPMVAAQC
jgi:hypothetical protein